MHSYNLLRAVAATKNSMYKSLIEIDINKRPSHLNAPLQMLLGDKGLCV